MVKAVIFDMDGLIVDSEPLWKQAEIEIFAQVGVVLTTELCSETMGLRIDRVVEHWYRKSPWSGPTIKDIETAIVDAMHRLLRQHTEALPGVLDMIEYLSSLKIPMAVCSSSPMSLINAVLQTLKIEDKMDVVLSAMDEDHGKPHPAAYIRCARSLKVRPEEVLVFEDSIFGAIAAKAALMRVIAIPDSEGFAGNRFGFCDQVVRSMADVDMNHILTGQ